MVITHIEDYERGHIYVGDCGFSKSGYCATTDDREQYGALLAVVDGADACAVYLFRKAWDKEKPVNKDFLLLLIPGLEDRIANADVKDLVISNLYKVAFKKLQDLGYVKTCPRCGGSGHYSYNQRDGTRCFKCGGKGKVLETISKKLLSQLKKEAL